MVGAISGKGSQKINKIRQISGSVSRARNICTLMFLPGAVTSNYFGAHLERRASRFQEGNDNIVAQEKVAHIFYESGQANLCPPDKSPAVLLVGIYYKSKAS